MNKGTVSVPDEQYERLAALAAARGVSPETQLARLIDDAYEGLDGDADPAETSRSASAPITRKRTTAVSSGRSLPITSTPAHFHLGAVGRLQFSLRLPRTRSEGEPEHDDIKQATPARMISPGIAPTDAVATTPLSGGVNTVRRTIHAAMRTVKSGCTPVGADERPPRRPAS